MDRTLADIVTEFAHFLLDSIEDLPNPHEPLRIPDDLVLETLVTFSDPSSPNPNEPVAVLVLRVHDDGELEIRYLNGAPASIARFLKDWKEEGDVFEGAERGE
jgi:hypothetical protein